MIEVTCPICRHAQTVDETKLPAKAEVGASCPQCSSRFSFQPTSGKAMRIECQKCKKIHAIAEICPFCGVVHRKFSARKPVPLPAAANPQPAMPAVPTRRPRHKGKVLLWLGLALLLIPGGFLLLRTTSGESMKPAPVRSKELYVSFAVGEKHSAICRSDGTVWTSGLNRYGQLGNGEVGGETREMQPVTTLSNMVAVAAGENFTVALKRDGSVWTWGINNDGQLGDGSNRKYASRPGQVEGLTGIVAISAGRAHVLALAGDGSVWAWGDNNMAQLATGFGRSSNVPQQITFYDEVAAIDAGANHGLALTKTGEVYAWGSNFQGEMGDGGFDDKYQPMLVEGLPPVQAISAGDGVSLALAKDGSVWQWGLVFQRRSAEIPSGDPFAWRVGCATAPKQVEGLAGITTIAAGRGVMLAIDQTSQLWHWKTFREEFDNSDDNPYLPKVVMASRDKMGAYIPLTGVIMVAAEYSHRLALERDGMLWAWGSNVHGELGVGEQDRGNFPTPVSLATGLAVLGNVVAESPREEKIAAADLSNVAIACGSEHSLLLRGDGTLWSWGGDEFGQLGRRLKFGDRDRIPAPLTIEFGEAIVDVRSGPLRTFALTQSGTVWTWGKSIRYILEEARTYSNPNATPEGPKADRPAVLAFLPKVERLAPGGQHYLALAPGGAVLAWGDNYYGQLGNGGQKPTHDQAITVAGLPEVVALAAGNSHSLALDRHGLVWAWGQNNNGQLGDGSKELRRTPVRVKGLDSVTAIEACGGMSLAIRKDGAVWGWGDGIGGVFRDQVVRSSLVPIPLKGLQGVTAVACGDKRAAGGGFGVALKSDGQVWSWGDNRFGQLGHGTTNAGANEPKLVEGISDVVKITATGSFTLALRRDGTVWGWGTSMGGGLGDNAITSHPVQIRGLDEVKVKL